MNIAFDLLTELKTGAVAGPVDPMVGIAIRGETRREFLNNFCSADVRHLEASQLVEGMVLNEKGKVISWGFVLAFPERLEWIAGGGSRDALMNHWDKYNFRDDVVLSDAQGDAESWFVTGPKAPEIVAALVGRNLSIGSCCEDDGLDGVIAAGLELAGAGYFLRTTGGHPWREKLEELDAAICTPDQMEQVRIGHATPRNGSDVGLENLPQELQRDQSAINFEKGCYLGQETVARIDAIGHVNQLFQFLEVEGTASAGNSLRAGDKSVGRITSACAMPPSARLWALGYVRRGYEDGKLAVVNKDDEVLGMATVKNPPLAAARIA